MKIIWIILSLAALASCSTVPATDLSGAGFVLESPSAEMRKAMIAIDRPFAETVAVNRATCMQLPGCKK